MTGRVLFVDDDPNILSTYKRTLRNKFELETAQGGEEGLRLIKEKEPFAVVVADMQMPYMNGIEFLSAAEKIAPDTVRMMLTGNADQKTAVDAVNEGNIFRFINKPCPPELFAEILTSGLQQYRLVTAEKELLDKTLKGSVAVMTEVLSLVNPTAFSKATRVKLYVSHMGRALGLTNTWEYEVASMLSMIGCVAIPSSTLEAVYSGAEITPAEQQQFSRHPAVGMKLLSSIPRLEKVAAMIEKQMSPPRDLRMDQKDASQREILLGAQLLRIADEYDARTRGKLSHHDIIKQLRAMKDPFDPSLIDALEIYKDEREAYEMRTVCVRELNVFMIVDADVKAKNGALLVAKGQPVTYPLLQRLKNFQSGVGVVEPIQVLVQTSTRMGDVDEEENASAEKPVTT